MLDVALLQTMGLTSLMLLTVGWWSGRLRETRDPQSALTPIAVGCAAAAFATIGYGVGQFLLGVDSPLSWQLVKDIVSTIALDALLGDARLRARAPLAAAGAARRSPSPPPARLHDRRPVAAARA